MRKLQNVIVTVAVEAEPRLKQIAEEMQSAGFEVKDVMADMGMVTGAAAPDCITKIRQISGVESVEDDRDMQAI